MKYYKFTDANWCKSLENGSFMFSSMDFFRWQESVTGDNWIGDMMEGRGQLETGRMVLNSSDPDFDEKREALERVKVKFSGEPGKIENCVFDIKYTYEHPPCHIFCFSGGELELLINTMCRSSDEERNYDGCVELSNIEEIARLIWETGIAKIGFRENSIDSRVSDVFSSIHMGPVSYGSRVRSVRDDSHFAIDPFQKDLRYKSQSEWRIVLVHKDVKQILPDRLLIHARLSDNSIRKVGLGQNIITVKSRSSDNTSLDSLIGEFEYLIQSMNTMFQKNNREFMSIGFGQDFKASVQQHEKIRERQTKEFHDGIYRQVIGAYWKARLLGFREANLDSSLLGTETPSPAISSSFEVILEKLKIQGRSTS